MLSEAVHVRIGIRSDPRGLSGLICQLHVYCYELPGNLKTVYPYTVELQWLEHRWDHGNLFEIWVVRATEGK